MLFIASGWNPGINKKNILAAAFNVEFIVKKTLGGYTNEVTFAATKFREGGKKINNCCIASVN